MIKFVALDMDGTLLNSEHKISKANREALLELKRRGIGFCLVSGRDIGSILPFARELGIDGLIAGVNGAIISDVRGNAVKSETLAYNTCIEALRYSKEMGLCPIVFADDRIFVEDKSDERYLVFDKYAAVVPEEVPDMITALDSCGMLDRVNKILLSDDNVRLKVCEPRLSEIVAGVSMLYSFPFFLEIFPDVSKAGALKYIIERLGIKPEEVLAMGDGENDMSMLNFVGYGFAMKNAPEHVKAHAKYIADSNDDDGVAKVIKEYILCADSGRSHDL